MADDNFSGEGTLPTSAKRRSFGEMARDLMNAHFHQADLEASRERERKAAAEQATLGGPNVMEPDAQGRYKFPTLRDVYAMKRQAAEETERPPAEQTRAEQEAADALASIKSPASSGAQRDEQGRFSGAATPSGRIYARDLIHEAYRQADEKRAQGK